MTTAARTCMKSADLAASLTSAFSGSPAGIIFDCDGVLADSHQANIYYYNLLREAVNMPPMDKATEAYIGMCTVTEAIHTLIPPALRQSLGEVARNISYLRDIQPKVQPMDGLREFIEYCHEKNILMAVHTNRTDTMEALLEQFGMTEFFDPVMTVAKVLPKPDPEGALTILKAWNLPASKVLFVGDSSTDEGAARQAQIPFLTFGHAELSGLGCCTSFREFLSAMRIIQDGASV